MFIDNKGFWPTPEPLIEKMLNKISWKDVHTVLEPSAGRGDIADAVRGLRNKSLHIDVCECDRSLQMILKTKKYHICSEDFLKYQPDIKYDVIIMNPPFDNGEKHLLHAIEILRQEGGQVVCLLSSATLGNAFSRTRKALAQNIEQYGGSVTHLGSAFLDAERSTSVHVDMVYIQVPAPERQSFIYQNYKKELEEEEEFSAPTDLLSNNPVQSAILCYRNEIQLGKRLIHEFKAVRPYLMDYSENGQMIPYFTLMMAGSENYWQQTGSQTITVNEFVQRVRTKYWNLFFKNDELFSKLTENLKSDFMKRIQTDFCFYDFTEDNIRRARFEMYDNLQRGLKSTILKLFDEFTRDYSWYPESKHNIHYFNGWLTNECYKVGEKVIIPLDGYYDLQFSWGGFKPTRCLSKLADIEKCFSYLDMEQTTAYSVDDLKEALEDAEKGNQTKNIKTRYMTLTFYKKGTCHIRFNDAGILQRFNIFGAQQKNWLPPAYGRKSYNEMADDEKAVIDSFEGADSYEQVCKEPEKYIIQDSVMPALCI